MASDFIMARAGMCVGSSNLQLVQPGTSGPYATETSAVMNSARNAASRMRRSLDGQRPESRHVTNMCDGSRKSEPDDVASLTEPCVTDGYDPSITNGDPQCVRTPACVPNSSAQPPDYWCCSLRQPRVHNSGTGRLPLPKVFWCHSASDIEIPSFGLRYRASQEPGSGRSWA